jgi:hypothetical protein
MNYLTDFTEILCRDRLDLGEGHRLTFEKGKEIIPNSLIIPDKAQTDKYCFVVAITTEKLEEKNYSSR